ncbi:MAG: carbohydrate kinase [Bacteroidetes bacterium]|nr:carbohydrate kinase [Bacteroidota bacterium]
MTHRHIIGFGEVLWDILPDGPVPGGAPMNAVLRLRSLGWNAGIISAVGNDHLGSALTDLLRTHSVDLSLLQVHPDLPTGTVRVSLNRNGEPTYDIAFPSAWDHITADDRSLDAVRSADAFIFGTLACRHATSRNTLFQLLEAAPFRVFDVNLRQSFYSMDLIEDILRQTELLKLNMEELFILTGTESGGDVKGAIQKLKERTTAAAICVTRGENGAVVLAGGQFSEHPGYRVAVADTVGAGDSFLAGFVSEYVQGAPVSRALDVGCALGAMVASRKGANPTINANEIAGFIEKQKHIGT